MAKGSVCIKFVNFSSIFLLPPELSIVLISVYLSIYSRYGSLKRRSLISPRAWKASFSEVHRSFSPTAGQRFSFRSPEKPRHSTLSREGSMIRGSLAESKELDTGAYRSEVHSPSAQDDAGEGASGNQLKSGDDNNQVEEEKGVKEEESKPPAESENKGDGKKDLPSASSSEINNSCESDSLELQLSAADNGPLHIDEADDSPVTLHTPKLNGLENVDASGLNSEAKEPSSPHKVCHAISPQLTCGAAVLLMHIVLYLSFFPVLCRTSLLRRRSPQTQKTQWFEVFIMEQKVCVFF